MAETTFAWLFRNLRQGAFTAATAVAGATPSFISYLTTQSAVNEVLDGPDPFINSLPDPGECSPDQIQPSTLLGLIPFSASALTLLLGLVAQQYQGVERMAKLGVALAVNTGAGALAEYIGHDHGKEVVSQLMDCGIFSDFSKFDVSLCLPEFLTALPPPLLATLALAVSLGVIKLTADPQPAVSISNDVYDRLRQAPLSDGGGDVEMAITSDTAAAARAPA